MCTQSADPQEPHDAVQAAMQKVNDAVTTAEKQLDKLESLPSAQLPRQVRLCTALSSLATCKTLESPVHHAS